MLVDAIGEQAALVEADIAGRRADQTRYRVRSMYPTFEAQKLHGRAAWATGAPPGLADAAAPENKYERWAFPARAGPLGRA